MTPSKLKPAAWRANRLPKRFALAAETGSDRTEVLLQIQAEIVARRFGPTLPIARLVASLAFAEARI
jgi:hypothetical protein